MRLPPLVFAVFCLLALTNPTPGNALRNLLRNVFSRYRYRYR